MEEALRSILLGDAGVSAQVGTRVAWGRRPQSDATLPAIVLHKITGIRDYVMSGASGMVESRVQVDCYGTTYAAAKQAARAVMTAVNSYSGTVSGTVFQRISIDGERDTNEADTAGNNLHRTSIDLMIWHDE